jgi:DNA polymerase III delta subunit
MVYLFTGQDSLSKDIKLRQLKLEYLPKEIEQFNLDNLYAEDLSLKKFQEKLSCLPLKAKKRIVVVRNAERLKEEIRVFLSEYAKKPYAQVVLVLDFNAYNPRDEFMRDLSRRCRTLHFKEEPRIDTFTLSRQIELGRPDEALRLLRKLLDKAEKPERILGGLRYAWEGDISNLLEARKRLKLLLECDIDIKTGRLKPEIALEKLTVSLCAFRKHAR